MAHCGRRWLTGGEKKGILNKPWRPVVCVLGVGMGTLPWTFCNQLPTGAQKNFLKVLSLLENKSALFKA